MGSFEDDIEFRLIDVDIHHVFQTKSNAVRLFGVTKLGETICCQVYDFEFKFLLRLPFDDEMPHNVRSILLREDNVKAVSQEALSRGTDTPKMSVFHYNSQDMKRQLYEITVYNCRKIIDTADRVTKTMREKLSLRQAEAYDVDIDPVLMFCIETNLKGCCWIKIPKRKFIALPRRTTKCERNVKVLHWRSVKGMPEKDAVAPFRILCFDIECRNRKGIFPEAQTDPVIQIALVAGRLNDQCNVETTEKYVLTLGDCAPVRDAIVEEFPYRRTENGGVDEENASRNDSERKMLERFAELWEKIDPDILTGYNISVFDIPYLLERGKHLKCKREFFEFGRIPGAESRTYDKCRSTKAVFRQSKVTTMPGRLCFDMIDVVRNDFNLGSYKLNDVCKQFLDETKDDVHHTEITVLFEGTKMDRQRLAEYCLQDAVLIVLLINKLMSLVNYIELSRIYGVSMSYLLNRGQQIKVKSMVYRYIRGKEIFVIPHLKRNTEKRKFESDSDDEGDGADKQRDEEGSSKRRINFQGATVMEPIKGLHDEAPTVVLDFSSLYPSIIRRYNLCYSTHLAACEILDIGEENVNVTPVSAMFVKPDVRPGILPEILKYLIDARNDTKAAMKKEKDEFKKRILNGKQLALKISANSIYGFTGDATSNLYCVDISSSVTGYGRQMLEMTKNFVESRYGARVIYGDTDSVMFNLPVKASLMEDESGRRKAIAEAIERGKEIAKTTTEELFADPISLEFEKVLLPMILCSKKRYCGLSYSAPNSDPKMDVKGLQAIRRDSCTFIRQTQKEFIHLLMTANYEEALAYLRRRIDDLKNNRVAIEDLTLSKLLRADYKNPQEHSEVRKKMFERDAATAPQVGDRIPFVYIANGCKRAFEKAEDPEYVKASGLPIDYEKYLTRLKSSLNQLMEDDTIDKLFACKKKIK